MGVLVKHSSRLHVATQIINSLSICSFTPPVENAYRCMCYIKHLDQCLCSPCQSSELQSLAPLSRTLPHRHAVPEVSTCSQLPLTSAAGWGCILLTDPWLLPLWWQQRHPPLPLCSAQLCPPYVVQDTHQVVAGPPRSLLSAPFPPTWLPRQPGMKWIRSLHRWPDRRPGGGSVVPCPHTSYFLQQVSVYTKQQQLLGYFD